jgi:hypothetical protein
MQTQPQMLMPPPPHISRPGRDAPGWGVFIVVVSAATVLLVGTLVLLFGARSDAASTERSLRSTQQELSGVHQQLTVSAHDLEQTQSDLSDRETELSTTKSDLADSNSTLSAVSACQYKLLGAWYGTTNSSYLVTGFALQSAVFSNACRASRMAYNQVT